MRFVSFVLLFLVLLIVQVPLVFAQSTVQLSGEAEYVFENDGSSTVIARFTLVNLDTNTYPAVFFLELPNDAYDVIVFDKEEPLEYSIVEEAGQKKAKIKLGDDAVGVKSEKHVTISYKSNVFASKGRDSWQIYIPPFTTYETLASYRVNMKFPKTWNQIIYENPTSAEKLSWVFEDQEPQAITVEAKEHGFVLGSSTVVLDQNKIIYTGIAFGIVLFAILYAIAHLNRKK